MTSLSVYLVPLSDHGVPGAKSGMQRITDDDKLEEAISKKRDDLLRQADQGDLISFGIVPELVGRFPVIVPFHSLDKVILLCLY